MLQPNVNVHVTVNGDQKAPLIFNHLNVLIENTSTVAIPENTNRKYLLIINNSDVDMFLSLNGDAVVNQGILINSGGNYQMSLDYISTNAISLIHSSEGNKSVLITEGV